MPEIFDGSQLDDEQETQSTVPSKEEVLDSVKKKRADRPVKKKRSVNEYSEVICNLPESTASLSSFAAKPKRVSFSTQAKDEEIILLLRKHPITQVKWIVIALLLTILPVFLPFVPFLNFLPANYEFAILIGWYLIVLGYSLESFLSWYYNVYIITDERVIDVDFLSLIYHDISSAKIDNIEDVTAATGGAIRALFNFGTVQIQTAAEKNEFEFEEVPQPAQVTKLLNELVLEEEREKIEGRVS